MKTKNPILRLLRREPVFSIAFLCAVLSAFWVPPSAAYLGYIDLRVLCLLFCLMAVVVGLQDVGVFQVLAQKLLTGERPLRRITWLLVMLPFFCSMLVTNDVALITFVPFSILVLEMIDRRELLIPVICLQTIAANLGSMATPVGNPQNLFLYNKYQLGLGEFLSLLLPIVVVSLVLLTVVCLICGGKGSIHITFPQPAAISGKGHLVLYAALFALCLLSVCRVLHYGILTAIVVVAMLVAKPRLLRRVDYMLLLTFVCFFIFSGNLGAMPAVRTALSSIMEKNTLLCSAAASQVISNVPAAVLLSGLTEDWRGLLAGVNVGGLGTPVASLASLISLKFYLRRSDAKSGAYLRWFTISNVIGLVLLLALSAFLVK